MCCDDCIISECCIIRIVNNSTARTISAKEAFDGGPQVAEESSRFPVQVVESLFQCFDIVVVLGNRFHQTCDFCKLVIGQCNSLLIGCVRNRVLNIGRISQFIFNNGFFDIVDQIRCCILTEILGEVTGCYQSSVAVAFWSSESSFPLAFS